MQHYVIQFTQEARQDMDDLYNYMIDDLLQPETAAKYFNGILEKIDELSYLGEIIAINQREFIQNLYGPNARTIIYKKMTIIYNIVGNIILVRRVVASSMIL